jgi:hypothetical protein
MDSQQRRMDPAGAQAKWGAGAIGNAMQGLSVALSGDGNKALVGGDLDNGATGAAWM